MPLRNTPDRFGLVARTFHWLIFLLLIGSFTIAWSMVDLPLGIQKLKFYSWHKWVGATVFLVVLLRLAWRLVNHVPAAPPGTPGWQRLGAGVSHFLLYAILIVMPLTGWIMSSMKNLPLVYLGLIEIPSPFGVNQKWAGILAEVHETLALILLVLVGIHVLAALYHHFVRRDDVLRRMLPWPTRLRGPAAND
jgi:cytochrome b561